MSSAMTLFQIAVLFLVSLLAAHSHPLVNASPSDLSKVTKRNGMTAGHKTLFRRQDYIEDSGANIQNTPSMDITINVPLNTVIAANQTLSANITIPHTSLVASARSNGGGNAVTITSGTFKGRKSGGGTRNEIYGSARYGSGYGTYKAVEGGKTEYTPDLTLNVAGRDFPHGFPPINWGNYSGGQGYFDADIGDYPGVTAQRGVYDAPPTETHVLLARKGGDIWFVLADGETLVALNEAFSLPASQGGCDTWNFYPLSTKPESPFIWPGTTMVEGDRYTGSFTAAFVMRESGPHGIYPWNIIQYYRGSSIALGNFIYDNTYAHNGNNNTDYWLSSPLNATDPSVDFDHMRCLNATIAAVAPIVNPALAVNRRYTLTGGQIAGIVIGSVAGVALILAGIWFLLRRRRQTKVPTASPVGKNPLGEASSFQKAHTDGATTDSSHDAHRT